jgi:TusA-related sulfurtransferase
VCVIDCREQTCTPPLVKAKNTLDQLKDREGERPAVHPIISLIRNRFGHWDLKVGIYLG